jgi:hypothetical protein
VDVNESRLSETEQAYRAVIGLLQSAALLSIETIAHLRKLKRLLEVELATKLIMRTEPSAEFAAD